MPQSVSYQLAKPLSPQGTFVGDVSYLTPRRQPVVLKNVGDIVDLARVDPNQFAHSSLNGILRNMVISGTVVSILVDVPEEVERVINSLVSGLMAGHTVHGAQGVATVVMLEPGVGVMVGNAPEATDRQQPVSQMPVVAQNPVSAELEPGVVVPGGSTPEQDAAAREAAGDTVPAAAGPIAAGAPDWKDNLALGQQKKTVQTSQDRAFLAQVSDNAEEPATLRNLAKNRIKELGPA